MFEPREERVRISAREMQLSTALVKSFSSDFSPEQFRDEYQEQLYALINAKKKAGDAIDTGETFGESERNAEVLDLMEALKKNVRQSKAAKSRAAKSRAVKKRA